MIELTGGQSARELCKRLLIDSNLFVKDLTEKIGGKNYLRLAVRTAADNDKLLDALKTILLREEF